MVVFIQKWWLINYAFSVISIQESWLTKQDGLCTFNEKTIQAFHWVKLVIQMEALLCIIHLSMNYKVLKVIKMKIGEDSLLNSQWVAL